MSYSLSITNVLVVNKDSVYEQVDIYTEFVLLTIYIQESMVDLKAASVNKETARLFVEFIVDKSGNVKDLQFERQQIKYLDELK